MWRLQVIPEASQSIFGFNSGGQSHILFDWNGFLLICPFLAAGSYNICSLQQISTEDSIVLPHFLHSIFTQLLLSQINFFHRSSKKQLYKDRSFHNKFNKGQAQFELRQQVQQLQDKAEWLLYIIYFGITFFFFNQYAGHTGSNSIFLTANSC